MESGFFSCDWLQWKQINRIEGFDMSLKRFVQLFVCYLLSIVIAVSLADLLAVANRGLYLLLVSIIGYIVLTVPLTVMTIRKQK